ncbi:Putative thioesterase, Acyl transferase domain superfamily, phosphopantetheine binding ACP [Septoria linicola]|uniref:Thioesterase, Acyl transferase domain superfamily, phosphopantetheine binding ACP n=1 Tax=Septoria linicola TaxID=215465 RepID=A0A9Q9AFU0_9PEZI|nr:Putative thioesterase, Acyl transferase domain superfamily, phosphopantetheine binding ACP [Septoria linicola]
MEPASFTIYAFGDQTFDITGLASTLLLWDDTLVSELAERTAQRLHLEVAELEPEQKAESPRFATLLDLLPYWKAGTLDPALCQALTCFTHVGAFLVSHSYEQGSKPFPTASTACLTGVCTGLLSAAAVSCSKNAGQLLLLGEEAIAVAFRLGALAANVGKRLANCSSHAGIHESWTAAIIGNNVDEIKRQADESDKQLSSSTYISAHISAKHVNISGVPSALDDILSALPAAGISGARLQVLAPYHAPHLYSESDVEDVLRPTFTSLGAHASQSGYADATSHIPIISNGEAILPSTFEDALRLAVADCLLHVVRYDLLGPAIGSYIDSMSSCSTLTVHSVALSASGLEAGVRASLASPCKLQNVESAGTFLEHLRQQRARSHRASRSKIAVLSCAGRFPRANSMDLFWDILLHGVDTHQQVPVSRWDARTHVAALPTKKNVSGTGYGCWLEEASSFDAKFFSVSPREAPQMDPAQRLALMCATEAIEQAGVVPGRTPSTQHNRIGVYFGVTSNDWMETNSAQDIDTYFIPGGNRAFIAGRVNYHFKFSGPSYSIDTACSSSLTAIQLACNALWRKEIDMAVVGGTNILTNPDMHCGLDRGHFLSRSGNCKTFDALADGYCRGEAVAVVVLKRLEDAIQDSDPIQACILSVATNHSADADSITRPHVGAQQELIDRVLREAGVPRNSISYAEMHGTGTQAGDVAESNSVVECLAPLNARQSSNPLYIGSAKANVGHSEAAAGITSLAKVLLMLKHDTIPPHCGITTGINPKMPDLKSRNTLIATEPTRWARPDGGVRRVLVNNFSAAGGNTALILEDPPLRSTVTSDYTKSGHTIVISAKTAMSLHRNTQALAAWVDKQDISDPFLLSKMAYTTTARRMHHRWRLAVTAGDIRGIAGQLRLSSDKSSAKRSGTPPRILFAFAGQGSEFLRSGVELYGNIASVQRDIEVYDRMCIRMEFPSIVRLFTSSDSWDNATPQALQLAAVCLQMALVRMWRSFGVVPTILVGHSLGEYPALYAAGVLSQSDVIYLVGKRAALMQEHCTPGSHAMLVVRSSLTDILALLKPLAHKYQVACVNGGRNVVLGGTKDELKLVNLSLEASGIQTAELPLPYAFHTSQVDPILDALDSISGHVRYGEQNIPVISPTFAGVPSGFSNAFAVAHCRKPVRMHDAIQSARLQGLFNKETICLEIGPGAVTSKMVKEVLGHETETFVSVRHGEHISRPLSLALGKLYQKGLTINWDAYHQSMRTCSQVLQLPAYQWELKDYWTTYANDWSLRKGDAIAARSRPALSSSTIHKVVTDTLDSPTGELVVESDLNREDMGAVVHGHKVYGIPLCTPSVYADIALTVGEYLKEHILSKKDARLEVAGMTIQSALVVISGGQSQTLRTSMRLDRTNNEATCSFSSLTDSKDKLEQHAHCTVRFLASGAACESDTQSSAEILARIAALYEQAQQLSSESYLFSRSMIYKMVGSVAEFDNDYRGLAKVAMNSHAFEAAGLIKFENPQLLGGNFNIHPAVVDALSQLGGFAMNANETTDLSSEIFVNHGWQSFQVYSTIDPSASYRSHVKMIEGRDKVWNGDITIFSGEQVVAKFTGIALQRVPRRLMEHVVKAAHTRAAAACGIIKPPQSAIAGRPSRIDATSSRLQSVVVPFDAILAIISSESGISVAELADAREFDDLGVDSLLSLLIVSRVRDELNVGLENSAFMELGTIGALRSYVAGLQQSSESRVEYTATACEAKPSTMEAVWASALGIVSQESGISTTDLADNAILADLGVDSLLSLIISSRLQEELNIDLPHTSLLVDCDSIGCLKTSIARILEKPDDSSDDSVSVAGSHSSSSNSSWAVSEVSPPETPFTPPVTPFGVEMWSEETEKRAARSLTIQGNSKTATQRLFLFPDGGGSATSYMRLPQISSYWAVIAFDSPFVRNPQALKTLSLAALLDNYLAALRQHQPVGPYHMGGWSAGGILAYALAFKLLAAGEEVSTLILIDSPSPAAGLDRLPQSFFDHCSSIGIFESEMKQSTRATARPLATEWLVPHFHATIEVLHHYHAVPMPKPVKGTGISVTIIWAGACAFDDQKYSAMPDEASHSPSEIEGIRFLTQRRTDFGPGKWAQLFLGHKAKVHTIEGEHHFSMMRRGAPELARIIREALEV